MLKALFWVALGAALALQTDRWWSARRRRVTPGALTTTALDIVNQRLEQRARAARAPGAR